MFWDAVFARMGWELASVIMLFGVGLVIVLIVLIYVLALSGLVKLRRLLAKIN
jgi:hypothetical protein